MMDKCTSFITKSIANLLFDVESVTSVIEMRRGATRTMHGGHELGSRPPLRRMFMHPLSGATLLTSKIIFNTDPEHGQTPLVV